MEIRISVDFGQGYGASLTIEDARRLYETLRDAFEPKESLAKAQERITRDLEAKGLIVGGPLTTPSRAEMDDFIKRLDDNMQKVANGSMEGQASPTEAPGTLRDEAQHQCKGLHCWCMVPRYEARPNGICNDPTIPVENW